MSQTITLPFFAIKMRFQNGDEISLPLNDGDAYHLNKPLGELAEKYASTFQKKLLDKGDFTEVLNELREGVFLKKSLAVLFPAAKDKVSFPAFELSFEYIYQTSEKEAWGMVPSLGVEGLGADEAELEKRLEEAIRAEFISKRRLLAVQQIITTAWFSEPEMNADEISLTFHAPSELEDLAQKTQELLLPKVAQKMEIDHQVAYFREDELNWMVRILKGRFNRNILLVGASGTGKTTLVRELAQRSKRLDIKGEFWETSASMLIKELTRQTGWQDNLSYLLKELTTSGDLLFISNLSELFEVGRYEGNAISMAEYMRPALSRGEITLISECTPEEKARIEVRSPGFLSFFQIIQIEPPSQPEKIISLKINELAGQHHIELDPEAVAEIIRLHQRFSPYSGMPGKPIRFLESIILQALGEKKALQDKDGPAETVAVDAQTVFKHYCQESGMPPFIVNPDLPMDTDAIRQNFNANVFGQERAVNAVTDILAAVKTALTRPGKPIASFLFVGPTGVGKTELAKVLAEFLFGDRERLLRFDMSEFSSQWSVMGLTGTGQGNDGLLTSAVRRSPFCVLLFDEIEKAHPSFYELLLQMLGEGRLTDHHGKLVNFCSAVIIMTSNIGAATLQTRRIGIRNEVSLQEVGEHFTKAVSNHFRPELFNRIDSVVTFEALSQETVRYVVEREIALFRKREGISFRKLDLDLGEGVYDFLAQKGYDPKFGARYLQRTVREELAVPLAKELNAHDFDDHLVVRATVGDGRINISVESDPLGFELLMEQWDKLTLSDTASHLRRHYARLMEGALFMRLVSEIDVLESEKKRLGEKFWDVPARSAQYSHLLGIQEKGVAIFKEITALEQEIALACMEQGPFHADFSDRLKDWEDALFVFKKALYSRLFPKHDTCHFGIFGPALQQVLPFYLAVFHDFGFTWRNVRTIWYRESGKLLMPEPAPSVLSEDDENETEAPATVPTNYIKLPIELSPKGDLLPKPELKGDIFCGLEMEVQGSCVWLFLKEEKGLQEWASDTSVEPQFVSIHPHLKASNPPDEVHRLVFFKNKKPRRVITAATVFDKALDIGLTARPTDLVAFFGEKMEERFKLLLENGIFAG